MKRIIPLSFLAAACAVTASFAAVPSLINYQGRLTDSSGDPVVGSKTFSVSIYDASTAGNLLYTESVGSVVLDNKGVYSFQFGSTGTSNTETSEAVATTDGTSTTYQKVLTNAPIVDGSLSISDGTYTWNQASGSSNESEFSVFYVGVTGQVTVIYSSAPAEGADITATYKYGVAGITGALSSGGEHWLELSVDGAAQSTRDRVLAVPFAARAGVAESITPKKKVLMLPYPRFFSVLPNSDDHFIQSVTHNVPKSIDNVKKFTYAYTLSVNGWDNSPSDSEGVVINFKLIKVDPRAPSTHTILYTKQHSILYPDPLGQISGIVETEGFELDQSNFNYEWRITFTHSGAENWGADTSARFDWMSVEYEN